MAKAKNINTTTKATETTESKAALVVDARVPKTRDLALAVFQAAPGTAISTNDVVAAIQKQYPTVKSDTLKYALTELRKASVIHETHKVGLQSILKLGRSTGAKLIESTKKASVKIAPSPVSSDLAILNEATAVLAKLQALVHRNTQALEQIAKLRTML